MSPRGRWDYYDAPARKQVQGGVVVAKPGKVADPVAAELIAAAAMESGDKILARGRTYARAGQVVAVQSEPGVFTAQIQGTDTRPYEVRLERTMISGSDRVDADCTCPYGCDYGWCKHAAALAYVAGFLIDHDSGVRAVWAGDSVVPADPVVVGVDPLTADEMETLRLPASHTDAEAQLARAETFVPHPWRKHSRQQS
jgi:hypothetical protein